MSSTNFGRDYGSTPTVNGAAISGSNPLPVDDADAATAANQMKPTTTGTHANVASSATVVTLQAALADRQGWTVFNDSTAVLYAKCGSGASATSYTVQVAAGGYWELPFRYTGIITGLWASANGFARVVEFT